MESIDITLENSIIRYTKSDTLIPTIIIQFAFKDKMGGYNKFLTLKRESNYQIYGFNHGYSSNISFKIFKTDITYKLFLKFLDKEKCIAIDSDDYDVNAIKYVEFINDDDSIIINMVDKKYKCNHGINILVKNNPYDKCNNQEKYIIKNRLRKLFNDFEMLFEEKNTDVLKKEYKRE